IAVEAPRAAPHSGIEPGIDRGEHRLVILAVVARRDPVGQRMDLAPVYPRQIVQHASEICVQLDSAIIEEPQNIMDRALRARGRGLKLRSAGGGPRWSECRHELA